MREMSFEEAREVFRRAGLAEMWLYVEGSIPLAHRLAALEQVAERAKGLLSIAGRALDTLAAGKAVRVENPGCGFYREAVAEVRTALAALDEKGGR